MHAGVQLTAAQDEASLRREVEVTHFFDALRAFKAGHAAEIAAAAAAVSASASERRCVAAASQ